MLHCAVHQTYRHLSKPDKTRMPTGSRHSYRLLSGPCARAIRSISHLSLASPTICVTMQHRAAVFSSLNAKEWRRVADCPLQVFTQPFWVLKLLLPLWSACTGPSSRQSRSYVLEATIALWASVGRYIQSSPTPNPRNQDKRSLMCKSRHSQIDGYTDKNPSAR